MRNVRIEYVRVGGDLFVVDRVGDVGILVDARTALNDRAYKLLADHARADDGWGVVGTCEIVRGVV